MFNVKNISKSFPQWMWNRFYLSRKSKNVLCDISFDIKPGEIMGMTGPNGAGKTTLLRILYQALLADNGEILYKGNSLQNKIQSRKLFGVCPASSRNFFHKLTARENLLFFSQCMGITNKEIEEKIEKLDSFFGLRHQLDSHFHYLSSGNQKRLSLMRALLHDPVILLLDEVTDHLDPIFRDELLNYLKEWAFQGKMIIFTSLRLEEIETICSKLLWLHKGKVKALQKLPSSSFLNLKAQYKDLLEPCS